MHEKYIYMGNISYKSKIMQLSDKYSEHVGVHFRAIQKAVCAYFTS